MIKCADINDDEIFTGLALQMWEDYRKKGFASELLREDEKWSKEKGCTEFASDCELVNGESINFQLALGFEEANRIICFRKEVRI